MAEQGTGATYCPRHKDTPTGLHCGRCETPVCPQCMVHGPVGVRCPDCGKPPKLPQFEVSTPLVLRAIGASLFTGIVGGFVLLFVLGYGLLFDLIASAGLGFLVSEATGYAANRKRGPVLAIIAVVGIVAGQVPIIVLSGALHLLMVTAVAAIVAYFRLRQP